MKNDFSYLQNAHPEYIEKLYLEYKLNGSTAILDEEWKRFFEGFDYAMTQDKDLSAPISSKEFQVIALINAYRQRAHLTSNTNPIRERKNRHPRLDLAAHGLEKNDLQESFVAGEIIGLGKATLAHIIEKLEKIYCNTIGFEYSYILNFEELNWLQEKIEKSDAHNLSLDEKMRILKKLNDTVLFEKFLSTKYIGQKRFSLEGGESTIPALDSIIQNAAEQGVQEIVLGMAHRGRLNVLANIMKKTYENIFNEFEGNNLPIEDTDGGDVKYHLGYSSELETEKGKKIYIKLSPNPSHLEAVGSVVAGFARAKADSIYQNNYSQILPILVHGDAAIAAQGSCYELLQMSELQGYKVGGTIHFVINNQIGFTTDYDDARSSNYSTSLASTVNAPVFHVNGDDPEAVVYCCKLAVEYRQKFHKDVFIDMVCYRKHGHNEGDDPQYTQPDMYRRISMHSNPREMYIQHLLQKSIIDQATADDMEKKFWSSLQDRLEQVKQKNLPYKYQETDQAWRSLKKNVSKDDIFKIYDTSITQSLMDLIMERIHIFPVNIKPIAKMQRMYEAKKKMYFEEKKLDWQLGELLAYSSLLVEGHDVRISGQDVKRGTFSHRHAVVMDEEKNVEYNRLNHIQDGQGRFMIYNSLLSEFAVLGFEYGYSIASPHPLVLWEAQFGDFFNGAQTIVDQFIFSSETKWRRTSGLVLSLPHGYEGQGPEHSSARLERFLQSCAENNVFVTNITTPANYFHALRRQLLRPFRKPLINMAPKSLLRHPLCVSLHTDFTQGSFQEVIDDTSVLDKKIRRVVFCSGKIYYELLEKRSKEQIQDIALLRVEQLYPCPVDQIMMLIKKYNTDDIIWCQEEPANMGAWLNWRLYAPQIPFHLVSRKASASTATGFHKTHLIEQEEIIAQALLLHN